MASSNVLSSLFFAILIAITSLIFGLFNNKQPQPYMDEIFHIPQAQNYCVGNLSHWNNKITTLPGLYIVSLIMLKMSNFLPFVGRFLDSEQPCSTSFLRGTNFVFMLVNFWLFFELSCIINHNYQIKNETNNLKEENKGKQKRKSKLAIQKEEEDKTSAELKLLNHCFANAFVLSLFPLLYFFTFLYYTDQGSTSMVLITYLLSLQDSHFTAALTGAVAVCFRQTNIVWVAFVAGATLLREIEDELSGLENGIMEFIRDALFAVRQKLVILVQKLLPYALIGIAFCVFIIKNKGIVVGDRSSHQACFHVPQLLYFIGFTMVFSFPIFFSLPSLNSVKEKLREFIGSKIGTVLGIFGIILIAACVSKFTYAHEYLLADNRHYTFYIWRKIFMVHWSLKYLVIPGYIYGAMVMAQQLLVKNSQYFILLFLASVLLVTVPQKLLEFRYFIIPYLIFRLHTPLPSSISLCLEIVLYAFVNCATVVLFLYRPFYWDNSDDVQRFMW